MSLDYIFTPVIFCRQKYSAVSLSTDVIKGDQRKWSKCGLRCKQVTVSAMIKGSSQYKSWMKALFSAVQVQPSTDLIKAEEINQTQSIIALRRPLCLYKCIFTVNQTLRLFMISVSAEVAWEARWIVGHHSCGSQFKCCLHVFIFIANKQMHLQLQIIQQVETFHSWFC